MPGPYDLALVNGDLPHVLKLVSGPELVVQRAARRLQRHLGEWFLDTSIGLPWVEWMQQKPPRVNEIGAKIRREVEAIPDVIRVTALTVTHTRETQALAINGEAEVEGATLGITVLPFGDAPAALRLRPSVSVTVLRRTGPIISASTSAIVGAR